MRGVCLTKWSVSLVILVVPMVMAADVVTEWNEKALACATAAKAAAVCCNPHHGDGPHGDVRCRELRRRTLCSVPY